MISHSVVVRMRELVPPKEAVEFGEGGGDAREGEGGEGALASIGHQNDHGGARGEARASCDLEIAIGNLAARAVVGIAVNPAVYAVVAIVKIQRFVQ